MLFELGCSVLKLEHAIRSCLLCFSKHSKMLLSLHKELGVFFLGELSKFNRKLRLWCDPAEREDEVEEENSE